MTNHSAKYPGSRLTYVGVAVALGIVAGTAIGAAMGHVGLGVAFGTIAGAAIGAAVDATIGADSEHAG